MLTGHFFSADVRGRLFDQVTSNTLYFRTYTDSPTQFDVPMIELWQEVLSSYVRPLLVCISQSWSMDYMVVTELHRRAEPYQILRLPVPITVGLWPEGAYPSQIAAPLRLLGVSPDESRQNRRFLWLPGVPRFTVVGGVGSNFSEIFRSACTTAAQLLCVERNFLHSPGQRVKIRSIIVPRRQPAGQPPNIFTFTECRDGIGPTRPGRVIRRTIGRGW